MSFDCNPYYNHASCGLEKVGEVDRGASYEFDLFVVWVDAAGVFYWGSDSGCSCPSPFEGYNGKEGLEHGSREQAAAALRAWGAGGASQEAEDLALEIEIGTKFALWGE